MRVKVLIIILSSFALLSYGQKTDSTDVNLSIYKYEIINVDTVVNHYSSGQFGTNDYKSWDSTFISADFIINELPMEYDSLKLKQFVSKTMKKESIDVAYIFRDKFSSSLFRMSSMSAQNLLKERKGYLGVIRE